MNNGVVGGGIGPAGEKEDVDEGEFEDGERLALGTGTWGCSAGKRAAGAGGGDAPVAAAGAANVVANVTTAAAVTPTGPGEITGIVVGGGGERAI